MRAPHHRVFPSGRLALAGFAGAMALWAFGVGEPSAQQDAAAKVEAAQAPEAAALLLDLGHHFKVTVPREGTAATARLPLRREWLEVADLGTLRLARYDAAGRRYQVVSEVRVGDADAAEARLGHSGLYSLAGLPADAVARGALSVVCRPDRPAPIDPICTKILCPAFAPLGAAAAPSAGLPPAGPGLPPFGSVCERCLGLGGRVPVDCELEVHPFDPVWPPLRPRPPPCTTTPAQVVDPSIPGPFAVGRSEYRFVDAFDIPGADQDVDVWATVRYPAASAGIDAGLPPGTEKYPLVVYLHGNHGIWDLGGAHVCAGSGTPVPNHAGYDYVLDRLASHGMVAVSINANDLNCKADRIVERGKLILEHLRRWRDWADPARPDTTFSGRFHGRVDLGKVGLAGHSRGGEAVISAYLENKAAALGFGIQALHSIAPVDFKSFVLEDVPYYLILPAADGDVSNLAGARIYDRAAPRSDPTRMAKMLTHVYGANHNWFNTVWFQDEGVGPDRLTADQQRAVERVHAVAFFRRYLKSLPSGAGLFDGSARSSATSPARLYRGYQHPRHLNVDDVEDLPPDPARNSLAGPNAPTSLSPWGEEVAGTWSFYNQTRKLFVGWNAPADHLTMELPSGKRDVSGHGQLAFRVAQALDAAGTNPVGRDQDLDVGLEDEAGNLTYVQVGRYGAIPYPYQRPGPRSLLHTVRIPTSCFGCAGRVPVDLRAVRRVHFRFGRTPAGVAALDSLQFTR